MARATYRGQLKNVIANGSNAVVIFEVGDVGALEQNHTQWLNQDLDIEIKIHKDKYSKQALAYLWALCSEIACKLGTAKEDVYRENIRQYVMPVAEMSVKKREVKALSRAWQEKGTGWFVELLDDHLDDTCTIALYTGCSQYDRDTMSKLIDGVVQDAKALGIPTETPSEIARMIDLWNA